MTIEALYPPEGDAGDSPDANNDRSLVLRLTDGGVSFLLAGRYRSRRRARSSPNPAATSGPGSSKSPHHGSTASSSEQFLGPSARDRRHLGREGQSVRFPGGGNARPLRTGGGADLPDRPERGRRGFHGRPAAGAAVTVQRRLINARGRSHYIDSVEAMITGRLPPEERGSSSFRLPSSSFRRPRPSSRPRRKKKSGGIPQGERRGRRDERRPVRTKKKPAAIQPSAEAGVQSNAVPAATAPRPTPVGRGEPA